MRWLSSLSFIETFMERQARQQMRYMPCTCRAVQCPGARFLCHLAACLLLMHFVLSDHGQLAVCCVVLVLNLCGAQAAGAVML